MASESNCPFTGGAQAHTNKDWWPNQLNLQVLHQHSSLSNPMGEAFNYAKEFKSLDLNAVIEDLRAPGDFPAVFLFDRPQEPARLVEVHVVRPAIDGRKTLLAASTAAPPIADAVRARAVPGHANEQPAVVPEVGRPPILRVRHHGPTL